MGELYFQWRVSSIKLYVQTLLVYILPEGNRAVTGKQKGKNIQSKMTRVQISVYAERMRHMHGRTVRQRVRHEWGKKKPNSENN